MRLSMSLALVATAFMACDSGGGNPASDETPTDETPTDETPTDENPVDENPVDENPVDDPTDEIPVDDPNDTPVDPGPVVPAYPEGPYGTGYLDTIQDLEFFDPWTGATPRLSDYYQSPDVSVLLISSAAGWCTACMYESWDLVDSYDKYKERGLEILYTLYEDRNADPIFQADDSDDQITADMAFFRGWQDHLGKYIGLPERKANYPTLVDRDFVLEAYYNQGATPLTLIVRTSDMKILYRQVGYSEGTIDQLIRGHLH